MQNAVSRALAVPDLTTTVLTLTITGIAADSHLTGGGGNKAGRRVVSACAMLLGAVVGALAVLNGHPTLPVLLAAVILAAASAAATVLARTDAPWTRPSPRSDTSCPAGDARDGGPQEASERRYEAVS